MFLVVAGNFFGSQRCCDWNRSMKVVGMGCSEARYRSLRLRPRRSELRMSMSHSSGVGEVFVNLQMCRQIGRRTQAPLDHLPAQVRNNNVRGGQTFIRHATGLDRDQAIFPGDSARIAERI